MARLCINLDTNIEPKVEGTIDTKQLNQQKEMTIIATDGAGNSSKVTLNATVKDITGPNIVLSTNKVSVDKGSNVDLKSYITSAVDNLDGDMKDKISFNTIDIQVWIQQVINQKYNYKWK